MIIGPAAAWSAWPVPPPLEYAVDYRFDIPKERR